MTEPGPTDAERLTDEDRSAIARLNDQQIAAIDKALLARCDGHWRKLAYVVGTAMGDQLDRVPGIPDVFYAQRIEVLVQQGVLEAFGNLAWMRYSEVRLAGASSITP